MKAVIYERYGPPEVLRLAEVEKPVPRENEVLVRIHATTVTAGDIRSRAFDVPLWQWLPARLYLGVTKPKRAVLGLEMAGDVEAVGAGVTRFKPGDPVFAFAGFGFGCYAEYRCLLESGKPTDDGIIAHKPANLTYEEAAAVPTGALTAAAFLRKANLQGGQQVLIYGASGSVGTYAVQLAKALGAEVTGVCSSANLDMVRSLGADQVFDYTRDDLAAITDRYDLIFDAVGKAPSSVKKGLLKPTGRFLSVHDSADLQPDDLNQLKATIEAGKLRPVIDCTYSLEQIVEAHRYVEQGHKRGNVVITVTNNAPDSENQRAG
ncbi:MAG: NAD(P)-dependent alcohol dehydrogenase [Anaerolineae bacterium]|nr:NAD(P)-dependent alcohol dehydrogenase [Anaerolineae bacterium]